MDFSPYDAVLLDLDGTIYHEEHGLPGAAQLVARLWREGRKFACLSNSTLSPNQIAQRLRRMHIQIDTDHIYSAAAAAVDYVLEKHGPMPRVFNLATEGIEEMLEGKAQFVQGSSEQCDAVIAGSMRNVYATVDRQRIALLLLRAGAELVGICPDRVYPSVRGLEFGVGAHCAMLGYAANTTPIFCGKPQDIFFHKLCQKLKVDPRRCVLIGDNLESDIAGARAVGMKTVLVLTGVTQPRDLDQAPAHLRPDSVARDLTEL